MGPFATTVQPPHRAKQFGVNHQRLPDSIAKPAIFNTLFGSVGGWLKDFHSPSKIQQSMTESCRDLSRLRQFAKTRRPSKLGWFTGLEFHGKGLSDESSVLHHHAIDAVNAAASMARGARASILIFAYEGRVAFSDRTRAENAFVMPLLRMHTRIPRCKHLQPC
jgi:hypothetical protein